MSALKFPHDAARYCRNRMLANCRSARVMKHGRRRHVWGWNAAYGGAG
ncbi:MAG: hypothetical protein OD918_07315 [Gammaproteobacteria bacterium]